MSDDGAIRMTAAELEMRFNSGGRFRLVALPFLRKSRPPKVGGQWPLITLVDYTDDSGPEQVAILTEALPEAYGPFPGDMVVVIPVHPAGVSRKTEDARAGV